ncbi:MAG: UDP-N-acetylmuramate--L-alanine ligase [Alphaproteobacteria bacterium]|nr:UDP-N-acetylmuramate--L-alanine ligase [Alphaproteobacteria bacterium]
MTHKRILPIAKNIAPSLGQIYFIGIGGIGMSSIAEVLHHRGFSVAGSDAAESYVTDHLKTLGIGVNIGQEAVNITSQISVIVRSTAIKPSNPELKKAIELGIPVIHRSDILAELMRDKISIAVGGTHGKTTTTAMVGAILDHAGLDPTIINGGVIHAYKSNARIGNSEYVVAEADESDGSFIKLPRSIAIITNIDPEHLDYYGTFEKQLDAFKMFLTQLPFYGFAVICKDHPQASAYLDMGIERRLISYGIYADADIKASNLRKFPDKTTFDITVNDSVTGEAFHWKDLCLGVPGEHNVENCLAALGVALGLHIPEEGIRKGLLAFSGVKRRFTKTGNWNGVTVIDDYAHHPKEISTTLNMASDVVKQTNGNVIAVFQPHRYSRVHDLFNDFCTCFPQAQTVIVADIYSAGETPIEGITQTSLVEGIQKSGHPHVVMLENEQQLPNLIKDVTKPGDIVLCMGAGSISKWAYELPKKLASSDHMV